MITLNYAKKVGDAYILNFFADSEEDIEKFDITKEFMFYGVPSAGSLITCVSKDSSTNYYVDKSGSLVKIDQDQPTPSLIPFNGDGTQYIAGYEFDTSLSTDEIKSILSKLSYEIGEGDAAQCMMVSCGETYGLVVSKVISTDDYYIAAVDDGNAFAIYGTKAGTIGEIPFAGGFENLTDGKYHFSNADTLNVTFVNNDDGWNGILIGAVEGEAPQPGDDLDDINVDDVVTSDAILKVNTQMSIEAINDVISNIADETDLVAYSVGEQGTSILGVDSTDGSKVIVFADIPIYYASSYQYVDKDTDETITIPAGWQYTIDIEGTEFTIIGKDGILNLSELLGHETITVTNVDETYSTWNGVILGAPTSTL